MWRGISLANKCLLLFGGAVVLIVLAALSVPWLRMNTLVNDGQLDLSRQMVDTWTRIEEQGPTPAAGGTETEHGGVLALRLSLKEAEERAANDPFLARAVRRFKADPGRTEMQQSRWAGLSRE